MSVVLYHYRWYLNSYNQVNIPNLGNILFNGFAFGVDLFFVISGFVIILSTEKNFGLYKNSLFFVLKRVFRIYPILIFFVLISIAIKTPGLILSIKSIIPVHLDYTSGAPFFGYNILIVAWTLTYEIFFYFIFLISMAINHKYRGVICCVLILSMFLLVQYYFSGEITLNAYKSQNIDLPVYFSAPLSLISSPMILEFCLGIIAYQIYKITINNNILKLDITKHMLAYAIFLLSTILITHSVFSGHGVLKWGVISFLLVVLITMYEENVKIKYIPSLYFLGNISYSIYMSHIPLIVLINIINSHLGLKGFPLIVSSVLIVIIISSITYYLIEMPAVRICRKINTHYHQYKS